MSSSVISNSLYRFIQDIEEMYTDYTKVTPKASYQLFYDYLNYEYKKDKDGKLGEKIDEDRENMKKSLTFKLMELCFKFDQMEANEVLLRDNRIKSMRNIKAAFTLIFVIITIIFIVLTVLVGKAYRHDWGKGIKMILTFVIIYLVITTLYVLLNMFIKDQSNVASRTSSDNIRSIQRLKSLMHNGTSKIGDPVSNMRSMLAYRKFRTSKKVDPETLAKDDHAFIVKFWGYVYRVMTNLHDEGHGTRTLKVAEMTSSNVKILKGVNDVLGTYYDLMLTSRQNSGDSSTKEGIFKILDKTVVSELMKLDVFSLDDNNVSNDAVFLQKLEDGENYKMLMKGFSYLMIYMYPVYKNVSYKKLVQLQTDAEEEYAKRNDKNNSKNNEPVETSSTAKLTDEESIVLNDILKNDPALTDVRKNYPLDRENFADELDKIEKYNQGTSSKFRAEIVDNFITTTVSSFTKINEDENEKYLMMMNNAPTTSDTRILMIDYIKNFNRYFEILYKQLVRTELAKLNPTSSQYYVFTPTFIRDKLNTYIKASPVLSKLDPNYTKMIIDILINEVVSEQKNRFVASYFDYENTNEQDKSLKVIEINSHVVELVQRVSASLVPYDFKVSDFSKYIVQQVGKNVSNISNAVSGAIESVISQIDYEVSVQRGLSNKTLGNYGNEARYVPSHEFAAILDQYKFNTLYNAMKSEYLQQIVTAINPDGSRAFASKEFKMNIANLLMNMLTVILVPSYLLYALVMSENLTKNKDIFAGDGNSKGKLETILQGDSIWGSVFKFGVPLAGCVLFISIYRSYVVKGYANIGFNKELMRENTDEIKESVDALNKLLDELSTKIPLDKGANAIGDLKEFDQQSKQKLYTILKNILTAYDRCNYIVGIDKYDIPFPYAEVLTDGLMSLLILGGIGYILMKFAPLARVVELKDLYEYKEASATLVNDQSFMTEILTKFSCHKEDVDGIMFSVKAIASMSVLVFMILYSLKIITSTAQYKGSLYGSGLYQNKKCAS
jgi:hypothetical protein